jgi:hypothetical protein
MEAASISSRRSFLASAVAAPLAGTALSKGTPAAPTEQAYQFTPPPPAGKYDFVVVELDPGCKGESVYHASEDFKKAREFGIWDKKRKRLAKVPFEPIDSPRRFVVLSAEWKSYEGNRRHPQTCHPIGPHAWMSGFGLCRTGHRKLSNGKRAGPYYLPEAWSKVGQ